MVNLNPVAVMIGKAMMKFLQVRITRPFIPAERPKPLSKCRRHEDVKFYGEWMRKNALSRWDTFILKLIFRNTE